MAQHSNHLASKASDVASGSSRKAKNITRRAGGGGRRMNETSLAAAAYKRYGSIVVSKAKIISGAKENMNNINNSAFS